MLQSGVFCPSSFGRGNRLFGACLIEEFPPDGSFVDAGWSFQSLNAR